MWEFGISLEGPFNQKQEAKGFLRADVFFLGGYGFNVDMVPDQTWIYVPESDIFTNEIQF